MQFKIKNLWLFSADGTMGGLEGDIHITDNLNTCSVQLTLKTKTINTDIDKRDKHLRSADFFKVEQYPEIHFAANAFKKKRGGLSLCC